MEWFEIISEKKHDSLVVHKYTTHIGLTESTTTASVCCGVPVYDDRAWQPDTHFSARRLFVHVASISDLSVSGFDTMTSWPRQSYFSLRYTHFPDCCDSSLFVDIHNVTIIHGTNSPNFLGPPESLDFDFPCGSSLENNRGSHIYIRHYLQSLLIVLPKLFCRNKSIPSCNSDRVLFF